MKKTIIIILSILFTSFIAKSQCVNCDGNNVISSTNFSSAIDEGNTSTGSSSFAAGKLNTASGNYSIALGYGVLFCIWCRTLQ